MEGARGGVSPFLSIGCFSLSPPTPPWAETEGAGEGAGRQVPGGDEEIGGARWD